MFADQLKFQEEVKLELQCEHRYSGAEMRCLNCGSYFTPKLELKSKEREVTFTDGFEYLRSHDI